MRKMRIRKGALDGKVRNGWAKREMNG